MTAPQRNALAACLGIVMALAPFATGAAAIDANASRIRADKTAVNADGIDAAEVSVTVKDQNFGSVQNAAVTLVSSRGSSDEIVVEDAQTDLFGVAHFRILSLRDGTSTITATANGVAIAQTLILTFQNGLSFPLHDGDLIKIPDDNNASTLSDTAVYYYASNGKRYVFPNEKVYFSWYTDFSNVKILPTDQMSLIPIGGNVTYRPGSKLVKFQTDVKTYLPTQGGVLRWVQTEDVARGLFGANWNTQVDDVSEAFYTNYRFGDPIASQYDVSLQILQTGTHSIDADKGLTPTP